MFSFFFILGFRVYVSHFGVWGLGLCFSLVSIIFNSNHSYFLTVTHPQTAPPTARLTS